ncbi:MAG: hypothetical protein OXU20_24275 [Myxococcales bacterium]|nr:hypothetical protein [Myxococcales bacterium]
MLRWLSIVIWLSACTGADRAVAPEGAPEAPAAGEGNDERPPEVRDADGDGLCDGTEADVGTDARLVDTDGDGFPDPVEVALGFEAVDPATPDPSHVAYLEAVPGAILDFEVRLTVDGKGEGYAGGFAPASPLYDLGHSAADFYESARADGADPVDNVREFGGQTERFAAVVGSTRLRFVLRFRNPLSRHENPDCVVAHPFQYLVKNDSGEIVNRRSYLLVLIPPSASEGADAYCRPAACL